MTSLARRAFLRGAFGKQTSGRASSPIFMPWAVDFSQFEALCTRCGDCLTVCPEHVVEKGSGGFPTVNFQRGECTFCGECTDVCQTGALHRDDPLTEPWLLSAQIGEACLVQQKVVCRTCAEQCEVEAIRLKPVLGGVLQPQVDESACTGCGACVAPCPTQAIQMVKKTKRGTDDDNEH